MVQVNIGLRVLTRPMPAKLPEIYRSLGTDYAERVLPSIIQVLSRQLYCFVFHLCCQPCLQSLQLFWLYFFVKCTMSVGAQVLTVNKV